MISWLTSKLSGLSMPSLISWPALAGALLIGIGCYGWGHTSGYGEAAAKGRADVQELRSEYATNLADAYREAAIKQQAEATRAGALAAELITTTRAIEAERITLRGRIVYVTRDIPADCELPADAVRLWNEARRLSAPGVPQAGGPGGAAGQSAPASAAGAGVQPGASIADGIANWVDYVSWCEGVVGQRNSLQELVRGWAQ